MAPLIQLVYSVSADDILVLKKTLGRLLNKYCHEGLKGSMLLLLGSCLDTEKIRFPEYNLILSFVYPGKIRWHFASFCSLEGISGCWIGLDPEKSIRVDFEA